MRCFLITCVVFLMFTNKAICQKNCTYPITEKVFVVGDSWANFLWLNRNYKEAFERFGYADYVEYASQFNSVENGANIADFMAAPRLDFILNHLEQTQEIEYVLFSICGNDVLGEWHKDFTQYQCDSLLDTVQTCLLFVLDTILAVRPDVKILLSGYDYTNFGETCAIVPTGAYYNLFLKMGSPSFLQINTILAQLTQRFIQISQNIPQVNFVNNLGLMQYKYGLSNSLIVPPYLPPYPPYTVPLPGGNINYPSPRSALIANIDAFHLNPGAYQHFANRHVEQFFWQEFRKPDTFFVSMGGLHDGYIDRNASINNDFLAIGNKTTSNQVSSIFSFNTSAIPNNAIITEARIFLTRASVDGQNPLTTYDTDFMVLDIKSGFFGSSSYVEQSDFIALASSDDIACVVGQASENNFKIRLEITDSTYLNNINRNGITQFRLRMDVTDNSNDNIIYFYGNNADSINKPVLDVKYVLDTTVSINNTDKSMFFEVFPNPTSDFVTIRCKTPMTLEMFNINGVLIESMYLHQNETTLNVSHYPAGLYFIRGISSQETVVRKIFKN